MTECKRILLADSDPLVLFTLRQVLLRLGKEYEVVTAVHAQDALDLSEQQGFHLIIIALELAGMEGAQLTEALQQMVPGVPIIWLTTQNRSRMNYDAKRLQIYHFLEKPFRIIDIRRAVQSALQVGCSVKANAKTQPGEE